jgi:hypothetical protein
MKSGLLLASIVQVSGDLISFMTGCSKAAGWCDGPQDASGMTHVITDQRVYYIADLSR